jgi:hypothetical protein
MGGSVPMRFVTQRILRLLIGCLNQIKKGPSFVHVPSDKYLLFPGYRMRANQQEDMRLVLQA